MIRSAFLRILFCCSLLAGMQGEASQAIDQFIKKIPYEQHMALEHVSQNMLTSMFACLGYVLYGNKPMCIIATDELSEISYDNIENKWFDFLTGLNIQPQDKKYPFVECKRGYLRHLIFINRELFFEAVNRNLPLFRYILGRTLTAESLLDALLKSGDHFYDTLKFNKALLGILLGYGTQNALLASREEDFTGELGDERSHYPFKDYETFIGFQHVPSIGFSTIQQEYEKLYSMIQVSTNIKNFNDCSIPHFGCDPSLKETQDLLSIYEKNRKQILQTVREGDCLAKLLKRICTTISGAIEPPQNLEDQIHEIPYEDPSTLRKYVDCMALSVLQMCKDPHFKEKPLIEAALKGMRCAEEGGTCPTPDWAGSWSHGYSADLVFKEQVEKKKADRFFQKLAEQNGIVPLIPKYVYHKVLVAGDGISATKNIKNATFHFSLYNNDGALMDFGTIKKVELEKLIPGVAYSLIGMQRGEERDIYIHPKYAYGTSHSSMIVTRTQLKLLDFEEGKQEAILPKIRKDFIDARHFQDFLKGYKAAKSASCFYSGYHFWKEMKALGIDLNLEEFSNRFQSESIHSPFQNNEEERKFLLDFNCYLFSRKSAMAPT